jgi:hypothetical protein
LPAAPELRKQEPWRKRLAYPLAKFMESFANAVRCGLGRKKLTNGAAARRIAASFILITVTLMVTDTR